MIEGSVETSAGAFHYLEWGDPAAPAQLLLHGFNQTAHSWAEYAELVGDAARVVALTQRGHGASMRADDGDYSRQTMVDDVGHAADALGLDRFALVGMSMGAVHAISFAGQHPERIPRLVIVDYAPVVESAGTDKIKLMLMQRWESLDAAVEAVRRFNPRRSEANIRERLGHTMAEQDDGRWGWVVDPAFALQERFGEPPDVMWKQVERVPMPALVVRGAQSDVLSPEMAARMIETLPDGRLVVIQEAGHSIAGDNPRGFCEAVGPFLGGR